MVKTLIFTATYNEKKNIKTLINKINKFKKNVDILIIDDNSPDGTGELLKKLQKKNQNLDILIRKGKLGLDTAHKAGFNYAKKKNYNNLITLDADLSHDPSEIPKMIEILQKKPFVIGSRYMKGGKCDMAWPRLLLSTIGNKVIKFVLNINCNEFTSSYRGFNLIKLKKLNLNMVKAKGYSFFMETIFLIDFLNFKIHQIPINFRNRTHGKSKIPSLEILRTLSRLFVLFFKRLSKD